MQPEGKHKGGGEDVEPVVPRYYFIIGVYKLQLGIGWLRTAHTKVSPACNVCLTRTLRAVYISEDEMIDGAKVVAKNTVLNMSAGEEMDILIAKEIFNSPELWFRGNVVRDKTKWYCGPRFSHDISAAWEVVEKLTDGIVLNDFELRATVIGWLADFTENNEAPAKAKTAPLAICRAALLAVIK